MRLKNVLAVLVGSGVLVSGVSYGQELTGTLKKIKDSGKVVMGVRDSSSPLSYTLGNGQYVGYHIDLCKKIIDDVKASLKLAKLDIEYQPVTSQNRIPLVENNTVDLECGSTTNNTARQKQVAFGLTTYVTEVRMAVKANSGITSIANLTGRTVATTTGTTSVQTLRNHERATGLNFKEVYGKDHSDSFLLMESGRADAFVMDDNLLAGLIASSKAPADYKIVGEVLSVEPIAVMFRKDDPAFKKLVDESIEKTMKSGELEKLYTKWFTSPIPPKNVSVNLPMGATLKGLLSAPNDKPMEDYKTK